MQHFKKLQREQRSQRQQHSRLALKNLFKATHDWGLGRREALELAGISSLHQMGHWSSAADDILLTDDQIEVISFLLTLHRAVALRNPRPKDMSRWLNTAITTDVALDGKSPIDFLREHPSKLVAARTLAYIVCQEKE